MHKVFLWSSIRLPTFLDPSKCLQNKCRKLKSKRRHCFRTVLLYINCEGRQADICKTEGEQEKQI